MGKEFNAFSDAMERVMKYQSKDPMFVFVDDWSKGHVGIFKAYCASFGLVVKEGKARGKKTLRISKS